MNNVMFCIWLARLALFSPYSCLCPPTKSCDFAGPGQATEWIQAKRRMRQGRQSAGDTFFKFYVLKLYHCITYSLYH